jgi:hypothetical protein
MYFHWQNLNEKRTDSNGHTPTGLPYHGRAWWHIHDRFTIQFSWHLWSHFCGLSATLDQGEPEIKIHAALPPVSLWLMFETPKVYQWARDLKIPGYEGREVAIHVHDWALWWHVWSDPHGWNSKTPRWRQGSFNIPDFFLGKMKYESRLIEREEVLIPMPEKAYRAVIEIKEDSWTRSRFRTTHNMMRAHVDMKEPIPVPGKGENSWDCDQDAIYSSTFAASDVSDAIGKVVTSVMSSRFRHGGRNWKPETKAA